MDTRELSDDKRFEERKIRQTMAHPTVGKYVMSGWPVRFGGEPPAIGPAAPCEMPGSPRRWSSK